MTSALEDSPLAVSHAEIENKTEKENKTNRRSPKRQHTYSPCMTLLPFQASRAIGVGRAILKSLK
jgi:hypothetical protein